MTLLITLSSLALLAVIIGFAWCIRRISLLRMTRLDFQECMNSPVFIIKQDGTVLSFRNAVRNQEQKPIREMYEGDKNVFNWVDESSRRILRQAIGEVKRSRERKTLSLIFLNSLSKNEVHLMWYGSRTLAFVVDTVGICPGELRQLQNEAHLCSTVLDNLPIATTVKDIRDKHRYILVNTQLAQLYGIRKEQLEGHSLQHFPADIQHALESGDQETLLKGVCDKTQTLRFPDGKQRTLSIHKVLVSNYQGQPSWIVTSAWDMSETVELRRAVRNGQQLLLNARAQIEASNRLKEDFLHNISHELRTPLNAIMGFSALLVDSVDDKERKDLAKIISNNCDALMAQVDDMMELSKIESGNINLHARECDINTLVEECIAEANWYDKPQVTAVKKLPQLPYRGTLDRRQVRVVLRQIISNALKYTDQGSIEIGYQVMAAGVARFTIVDTGIGMPAESCEKAFERFEKLGSMRPGIGLGLSITRALVTLMKGKIILESKPGVGTKVEIFLPCGAHEAPVDESLTVSRLWDQMITVRTQRS